MSRDRRLHTGKILAASVLIAALAGCAIGRTVEYPSVDLARAAGELPDTERLDVGIVVFDPGLPEGGGGDDKKMIFPEVRQAESRYMPYHLKTTLEASGQWGTVWVVPEKSTSVDLTVWGRVDRSDGLNAAVRVGAWDATGRQWLNKTYETVVPEKNYSKYRDQTQDPYQNIYNSIANDLLAIRQKISARDLDTIRRVGELRFGADLVPAAFAGRLQADKSGHYKVVSLPAEDDPMVARMRAVREREYTLVDTLNEYYANLYFDLDKPYEDWRKMSREEMLKYQDLRRSAFIRGAAGVAAIMAAVLYESNGGGNGAITTTAVIGGIEGIKSGMSKNAEASIHRESLKELGASFNSEAEPVVVEIEGQTRRLTGTAEEKYKEWRKLLHEIYTAETGFSAGGASADATAAGATPAAVPPAPGAGVPAGVPGPAAPLPPAAEPPVPPLAAAGAIAAAPSPAVQ